MRSRTGIISLLFIVLCVHYVLAQTDTCPDLVETALEQASDVCVELGRNQACYGNINLTAQARDGVSEFTFTQQGDIVNLIDIQNLTLDAMDVTNETWGIALLKLQANLPDTAPGQNVTMVLFGNVEVEAALVTVSAANNSNVRAAPSTDAELAGTLTGGESVRADGRLEDSSWLRVTLADGATGWVRADLVTTTGEVAMLPIVSADDAPFTPLQAFYFATAIGDAPCAEAPDSGILVQSPLGAGEIALTANGVDITLGSTAYLQAQPGTATSNGQMTVSVVEGQGTVEAAGVSVTIPAGTQATIPLDENGIANGAPQGPTPYDGAALVSLPVSLLPETITIAEPSAEATEVASTGNVTVADLAEGEWTAVVNIQFIDCPEPYVGEFSFEYIVTHREGSWTWDNAPTQPEADEAVVSYANGAIDNTVYILETSEGTPEDPYWTVILSSSTSITSSITGFLPDSLTCSIPMEVTLTGEGGEATPESADAASAESTAEARAGDHTVDDLAEGEWIADVIYRSDCYTSGEYEIVEQHTATYSTETGFTSDSDALNNSILWTLNGHGAYHFSETWDIEGTDATGGQSVDVTIVSPTLVTYHHVVNDSRCPDSIQTVTEITLTAQGGEATPEATAEATADTASATTSDRNVTVADLVEGEWTAVVHVEFIDCPEPYVGEHSIEYTATHDEEGWTWNIAPDQTAPDEAIVSYGNGAIDQTLSILETSEGTPQDPYWTVTLLSSTSLTSSITGIRRDSPDCSIPMEVTLTGEASDTGDTVELEDYAPGNWTMDITVDFSCMSTDEFTFESASATVAIVKEEAFPYDFHTPNNIYEDTSLGLLAGVLLDVLDQLSNRVMDFAHIITLTENTSTSIAGTIAGAREPYCATGTFTMTADE